jgi:hypothetical protein
MRLVALLTIWEFTKSNSSTFVMPNASFRVPEALASSRLIDEPDMDLTRTRVVWRLSATLAFNCYPILIFDLANQRSAESIQEDTDYTEYLFKIWGLGWGYWSWSEDNSAMFATTGVYIAFFVCVRSVLVAYFWQIHW